MVRVSLKEAYDDRSVIKKIADLEANKQDKLTAGEGVTIDGTTINVDTSQLATKTALNAEAARLDQKIDAVDDKIPPLASKEELNQQTARLDARVDASNVKIKSNADAILAIEDELGSDGEPGTILYRITRVEGEIITLNPIVNGSIRSVEVEGDASTVYHRATHNSGVVENDALPVASDTKAGVMSAGMYVGFNSSIQNLQARMSVLEGVGLTYQLTGLPDNPTDAQITAAFRAQYPNVPLSAGIRAADYDKAKIWQYSGTAWIQLTSININVATSTKLGVVKGSVTSDANAGRIFVEVDGSMTVIGWDTLRALAASAKQSVDNLEPQVTAQSAEIDQLEGDVAANASDITTLKSTTRDQTSRIESLESTSVDLKTRMGTAEGEIDTLQASDAQQTARISALEADMDNVKPRVGQLESDVGALQTKSSQNTQAINDVAADVNGLKTSKQDRLTAGTGITIDNDVISSQNVPIRRAVEGKNAMLEEFRRFMSQGEVGDTYEIMCRFPNSNNDWQNGYGPYAGSDSFFIFGNKNEDYMRITFATAVKIVNRTTWLSTDDITMAFYGKVNGKISGSSKDDAGMVYITRHSDNYAIRVYRYGNPASLGQYYLSGPISLGLDSTTTLHDEKAYVNYAPKA